MFWEMIMEPFNAFTPAEFVITALFAAALVCILIGVGTSILHMLAEINAAQALDPEEKGIVSSREIEREAQRRYRSYVVAIKKTPIFPFFLLFTLIRGILRKGHEHYVRHVARAVRRFWAY